jgi:hypothetical protein
MKPEFWMEYPSGRDQLEGVVVYDVIILKCILDRCELCKAEVPGQYSLTRFCALDFKKTWNVLTC